MGKPRLEPREVPFQAKGRQRSYPLKVAGEDVELGVASMGNPHAVLRVNNVDDAPLETIGRRLERHPRFPQRVNVGFMQVISRQTIRLRVFERGVGETLACGTGACAAVVVGIDQGLLDPQVRVVLRGGELDISWKGGNKAVMMTGPAETVFEGQIEL